MHGDIGESTQISTCQDFSYPNDMKSQIGVWTDNVKVELDRRWGHFPLIIYVVRSSVAIADFRKVATV